MKELEKEEKSIRFSLKFENRKNNKLKSLNEDQRTRSLSLYNSKLLNKYIPKLKPIETNINPSPINLISKDEIIIEEDNFKIKPIRKSDKKLLFFKEKSIEKEEEFKDNLINTRNECFNNKIKKNSPYSRDNDSKDKENKNNKNSQFNIVNKNVTDNIIKSKKNDNFCINEIRKQFDKIKKTLEFNNFEDDSKIIKFSYSKYFKYNDKIGCGQKFINKLKLKKMKEYEKYKNKTVNFKDLKSFRPPILGFLQMNETSNNTTLSSCNLSEI